MENVSIKQKLIQRIIMLARDKSMTYDSWI